MLEDDVCAEKHKRVDERLEQHEIIMKEQIFQNIILAAQLEETNKENRELKVELENMKGGNK